MEFPRTLIEFQERFPDDPSFMVNHPGFSGDSFS